MSKHISEHEGKKYLRTIVSCVDGRSIEVDVYDVLEAFKVTCQARAHAIKKLLCAGLRQKGSELTDLLGVDAAVQRAIQLQKQREQPQEWKPGEAVINLNGWIDLYGPCPNPECKAPFNGLAPHQAGYGVCKEGHNYPLKDFIPVKLRECLKAAEVNC